MALFCKLPSGGGLSKTKPVTSYDLRKSVAYGDIIHELTTSYYGYPVGSAYYEEKDGQGTLYVPTFESGSCRIKIFKISATGILEGESIYVQGVPGGSLLTIRGDKNTNVLVMCNTNNTSSVLYCINKSTHEVTTIDAPRYGGEGLAFYGATTKDGVIYASIWCNLNQPYLYRYKETGELIGYFENNGPKALFGNSPVQFDDDGNIYMSCNGNGSNTSSTALLSVTREGTLRWRKTIADLNLKEGTMLLNVAGDGTILCFQRYTPFTLIKMNRDGEVMNSNNSFFDTTATYSMSARNVDGKPLFHVQEIGGGKCYLCDDELTKIETFEITTADGKATSVFLNDKVITARYNGKLIVETRKPYAEYLKR